MQYLVEITAQTIKSTDIIVNYSTYMRERESLADFDEIIQLAHA
jgi:hypothetical protein